MYIGTESNTVCTLGVDAIPSSVTDIYVPEALVDSYKTATNWIYYSDKIFGISLLVVLSTMYPIMTIPLVLEVLIGAINIKNAKTNDRTLGTHAERKELKPLFPCFIFFLLYIHW